MASLKSMCGGRLQNSLTLWKNTLLRLRKKPFALSDGHLLTFVRPFACQAPLRYRHGLHALCCKNAVPTTPTVCFVGGRAYDSRLHTLHPRCYSASSQTSGSSLTDDILKKQTGEAPSASIDTTKASDSNKSSDDKKKKEDSWFSNKNAWKLGLMSLSAMGVIIVGQLVFLWGTPIVDKEGLELRDEFTDLPKWKAYPLRAFKEFNFFTKMIQDPSSEKLLPDPLQEPWYQPPYTVVLEMTGVMVHPDWTLGTGWRFKKRPAVEYFLQQIGPPLFEVVIYTHEQGFTAFPIIDGLDPNGYVSFRLFRDATKYKNGSHVKDLACLNRDLSKVIMVDCDPNAYQLHPRNAIGLKRWTGNDDDRTLLDLATFLRTIAMSGVGDVREVLDHYNQFDDPLQAFKDNQRLLQQEQERLSKTASEQQEKKSFTSSWSRGLTGRRR